MAEIKYEEAIKRLEKLVQELDTSELGLEARLKKFEEGTKLARLLLKKLEQAKKKVEVLVGVTSGDPTVVAADDDEFTTGDNADAAGRSA
jgi:exodeoxyribonuclease VII small subunit